MGFTIWEIYYIRLGMTREEHLVISVYSYFHKISANFVVDQGREAANFAEHSANDALNFAKTQANDFENFASNQGNNFVSDLNSFKDTLDNEFHLVLNFAVDQTNRLGNRMNLILSLYIYILYRNIH